VAESHVWAIVAATNPNDTFAIDAVSG